MDLFAEPINRAKRKREIYFKKLIDRSGTKAEKIQKIFPFKLPNIHLFAYDTPRGFVVRKSGQT